MMLWLIFVAMTGAVLALLLWPLRRTTTPGDGRARRAAAIMIAVVLPLTAGLLYAAQGAPGLADQPYAWRLQHDPDVILADAAARLERAAAADPTPAGYRRLVAFYLRLRDNDRAKIASAAVFARGGDSAADYADRGEIAVAAAQGTVDAAGLAAFATALQRDRREPRARFFIALAAFQAGDGKTAIAIWRDLEAESASDAPWRAVLTESIARAAAGAHIEAASIAPAPPTPQTIAALRNRLR
jgi:cytochrome c-type biogenesis protein CcmH